MSEPTEDKPPRQYVVVDLETNGLEERHQAVEIAWWNMATGARGCFVPVHDVSTVLANASIEALRINRYVDRLATAEQDSEGLQLLTLANQLQGNTMVGSNVRFDAAMLRKLMPGQQETWHYRLLDLGSYAAGVLNRDPDRGTPGLWELCKELGVVLSEEEAHTAAGDVMATGQCLLELWKIVSYSRAPQRWALPSDPQPQHFAAGGVITAPDSKPDCACCAADVRSFHPKDNGLGWDTCGRDQCGHQRIEHRR